MVEGIEGGGPKTGSASEPASIVESDGGRVRFTVDLRPGETTIVSWKKLLREANWSKQTMPDSSVQGPEAQFQPVSHPPPPPLPFAPASSEPPSEKEENDFQVQATSNRLSNVIERIERMYAGNGSSDEEDVMLDNVPDDDEYDTEDSFIDDAELDEYFQVDNSAIKHHGFFVNRGKLDRIEPTSTSQQPKKRKHKDLTKGQCGSDAVHDPNKIVKIGNKGRKASLLIPRNSTDQSPKVAMPNIHGEDMQFQAAPEASVKMKSAGPNTTEDSSRLLNGGKPDSTIRKGMNANGDKPEVLSSKVHGSRKGKESEPQDTLIHRPNGKSSHASKSHSGKQLNNVDDLGQSTQQKEKDGIVSRFDINVPESKESLSNTAAFMPRKEGYSAGLKNTTLENAIRELEKTVAESRPPSTAVQNPDNTSQASKKRLTPEIKQKLSAIAEIANTIYVKVPMDLMNRLMNIVGHLMQLRSLKRNLKVMANMGLSAEKEKDDRIEKIKQEVAEMIKQRIPYMKSKAEQQAANADDFQEAGLDEKEALKRKYSMDDVLGNKICDLYDLYVERVDDDSGPPVRRMYQELVGWWPSGFMDIDGIKRAIYRAKDRRGQCSSRKGQEKMKKKNVALPPKAEEVINNATKALQIGDKPSSHACSTLVRKPAPNASRDPVVDSADAPEAHKPKREKGKGSSNGNNNNNSPTDTIPSNLLPKKKLKKKPNPEALEKVAVSKADYRLKHHKQTSGSSKVSHDCS